MGNIVDLQERRAEITRHEAQQRFGGWNDWSAADINYLLNELADVHWTDCGETMPGFAVALGGLTMAMAANEIGYTPEGIQTVLNGMWIAADYLLSCHEGDIEAPRVWQSLNAIHTASKWTGGMPYCDYDIDDLDALREAILNSGPLVTTRKG